VFRKISIFFSLAVGLASGFSWASGVVLNGTRIIYPAGQKQTSISVRNTSTQDRFMVQSWAENAAGKKNHDFIVTPPLYVSNPTSENTLRLVYTGPDLPSDRETLYYLTVKSIPAIDKEKMSGKNVLMLSTATRIKIFMRPAGLSPQVGEAPSRLTFSRNGKTVTATNPTPYYLTLTQIRIGKQSINGAVMLPPFGNTTFSAPSAVAGTLYYRTINDYGGLTDEISRKL
jgi:fimbrial chaperone protein